MKNKAKKQILAKEGDIILLKNGDRVYGKIQAKFVYSTTPESTKLVRTDFPIGEFEEYPPGRYLVVETKMNGGQENGGMTGHDSYPDGHHVYCEMLNSHNQPTGIRVDFYQNGAFTAIIENPQIVGKMEKKVIWTEIFGGDRHK